MNDLRYGMNTQIVPLISPVDIAATATSSPFVKVSNAHRVAFEVFFGTITGDTVDVTLECATANSTSGLTDIAVPFYYRLSGAVGVDTWSAVTSADSTGVGVTASDDDKILLVDYDPRTNADYQYVRVTVTPGSSASAVEVSVTAFLEPRYGQLDPVSST